MIVDAHTHRPGARHAVISVDPLDFSPQPGLHYSVGLHPWQSGAADVPRRLERLRQVARHPQVVAIGETGLDGLRGAPLERQQQIFDAHVALACQLGKPLVLHWVKAPCQPPHGLPVRVMVHGFRRKAAVARPLLAAGCYLSFGPQFNAQALVATPRERLLIETDDSPVTILQVAQAVARALQLPVDELLALVQANAGRFFGTNRAGTGTQPGQPR